MHTLFLMMRKKLRLQRQILKTVCAALSCHPSHPLTKQIPLHFAFLTNESSDASNDVIQKQISLKMVLPLVRLEHNQLFILLGLLR